MGSSLLSSLKPVMILSAGAVSPFMGIRSLSLPIRTSVMRRFSSAINSLARSSKIKSISTSAAATFPKFGSACSVFGRSRWLLYYLVNVAYFPDETCHGNNRLLRQGICHHTYRRFQSIVEVIVTILRAKGF